MTSLPVYVRMWLSISASSTVLCFSVCGLSVFHCLSSFVSLSAHAWPRFFCGYCWFLIESSLRFYFCAHISPCPCFCFNIVSWIVGLFPLFVSWVFYFWSLFYSLIYCVLSFYCKQFCFCCLLYFCCLFYFCLLFCFCWLLFLCDELLSVFELWSPYSRIPPCVCTIIFLIRFLRLHFYLRHLFHHSLNIFSCTTFGYFNTALDD